MQYFAALQILSTREPLFRAICNVMQPDLHEALDYSVHDSACGTGGFPVEAYAHMLAKQVELTTQFRKLRDETFYGQEKKPLPYLLGVMNTVLHEIPVPHIVRKNTLSDDIRKYTKKELLEEFNLYAIVSLPAGVFANVVASGTGPKTDLLFFDHLGPTRQIWYYEVSAVGFSLTKTQKAVAENDLPDCLAMWKAYNAWRHTPAEEREPEPPQNERSWIVPVEEIVQKNYDLSAANPKRKNGFAHRPPEELIADIADKQARISELIAEIQELLAGETENE